VGRDLLSMTISAVKTSKYWWRNAF
jgi:hypothetical protein